MNCMVGNKRIHIICYGALREAIRDKNRSSIYSLQNQSRPHFYSEPHTKELL